MLENAIAKVRKLPENLQDMAAERLMEYVDESPSAAERVSTDEAREAYANGDFVTLAKWRHETLTAMFDCVRPCRSLSAGRRKHPFHQAD